MANERLFGPATRFLLASPLAFADWQNPTSAELNANPSNAATGLIWDITCALSEDGTTFDLGDSETDDSLSFCQVAGAVNPTSYNPEITYSIFRAKERWLVSDPNTFNTAELARTLLTYRGIEYFAILSVGEEPGTNFAPGDRIKMAKIATDYGVDEIGSGDNAMLSIETAGRGDILWNYELTV